MAAANSRKTSNTSKSVKKNTSDRTRSKSTTSKKGGQNKAQQEQWDGAMFYEIGLIVLLVVAILLFCCNFGLIGPVGSAISSFQFGLLGWTAYVAPIILFVAIVFWFANEGRPAAYRKVGAGTVLFLMFGVVCDMAASHSASLIQYDVKKLYEMSSTDKKGGGVLGGSIAYFLHHYLGTVGTVLVVILCVAVSFILLTNRSLLGGVKDSGGRIVERSRQDAERRREYMEIRRQEQEEARAQREETRRRREEEREQESIPRVERKVSGVMLDTTLKRTDSSKTRRDMHEISYETESMEPLHETKHTGNSRSQQASGNMPEFDFDKIKVRTSHPLNISETEEDRQEEVFAEQAESVEQTQASYEEDEPVPVQMSKVDQDIRVHKEEKKPTVKADPETSDEMAKDIKAAERKIPKKYMFPPLSRLQRGPTTAGDSTQELKETAMRLQQTLHTFGVNVTITDISQGPSVTRYELQPEQGVKVSKIVGLADDIKLNLAATDIRIEAPIPGKAAIGIEVPNKENMMVALRDLLETKEFKEFPSNIGFAVGKDIAGQVVVADIAKMPHMLIAGSTGSGKSVCINTLIMSILYKAHPDDVKLIMVDPKVVELSVYNGIPHLLIPVVTDPKKAAAALHWGVSEMEDRYRKFADFNVRDLKGYNKKVESMRESGDETAPAKLPQIVIIVDELADLMMVCPGEVEESICRLAQLARAAGIHLIIATQRPSVDVITGLIKANMPSRVAFAVSSGVDSRTILDMNGAEKLLGKGDMLFYPQGYAKPARIQGAFVSDKEVADVVDFLKNQTLGNTYAEDVEEKIKNIGTSSGSAAVGDSARDELFAEAGRCVIDKDKASIGMLQRMFKIGFNRAARIMDQLCEYGVVGEEEGTKPRKVLMSPEQFEQLLEEI